MKKILTAIAIVATTVAAFAQGYVTLSNGTGTFYSTNGVANLAAGETANTTAYYFDVLVQAWTGTVVAATGANNPWTIGVWSDTGVLTPNAQNGQPGKITAQTGVTAASWAVGLTNEFVIVGWSADLGTTWSAAKTSFGLNEGTWYGWTLPSFAASGAAPPGVASILWSNAGAQPYGNPIGTGMELNPVPEPTTLALAGLGGLALLLLRRRH